MFDLNFFDEYINQLSTEELREKVKNMLLELPIYFWSVPASTSGKYHPITDLGDGGTLRHSEMVVVVALDLLRTEQFIPETPENKDKVIIAALFHDSWKCGTDENGEKTVFEHPDIAAQFVLAQFTEFDFNFGAEIAGAIATHMGKWNKQYGKTIELMKPLTEFERLIHIADYMAARKYAYYHKDIKRINQLYKEKED